MVRGWGCAWKRLMTCLILSHLFSCHMYTYEEKSTLHSYLPSETQMDRQRSVPGPFGSQMNLWRKCILLCASELYQREGFSMKDYSQYVNDKKVWITQKEGRISIITEESQDHYFLSFLCISTYVLLHKQYPRHNSKVIYLWHWNLMLLFSLTDIYWGHTTYQALSHTLFHLILTMTFWGRPISSLRHTEDKWPAWSFISKLVGECLQLTQCSFHSDTFYLVTSHCSEQGIPKIQSLEHYRNSLQSKV